MDPRVRRTPDLPQGARVNGSDPGTAPHVRSPALGSGPGPLVMRTWTGRAPAYHANIIEGKTARVQVFQGYVMGRQGYGVRETFRVRKVSFGIGVERVFPVHSPVIDKIEVVTKGDVRRAKLYYMRDRHGKAARIREKRVDAK